MSKSYAITHQEQREIAGVASECMAHHLTYGGRCLNCGFDPDGVRYNRCSHDSCGVPAVRIASIAGQRGYTCGNHDEDRRS